MRHSAGLAAGAALVLAATALHGCQSGPTPTEARAADHFLAEERAYLAEVAASEAGAAHMPRVLLERRRRVLDRGASAREQGHRALAMPLGTDREQLLEAAAFRVREATDDLHLLDAALRTREHGH